MKVLILSHNSIDTFQSMGKTFLSLFSEFDKEEVCQLYIYPSYPDIDVCSSYYRVTDKDVLKSCLNFSKPGREVDKKNIKKTQKAYEDAKDEKIYRNKKNKSSVRRLFRDFIWKLSKWDNSSLEKWLEKEKPSVIFVAPGVAKFIYDIALSISNKLNIPIVVYICDEYYFVKSKKSIIDKIQLKQLQNRIEELMNASSHLVTISDELNMLYSKKFEVESTTIMTGSNFKGQSISRRDAKPNSISYFGNIRCNRFYSLRDIGEVLDEINKEQGTDYKLKIYSAEKDSEILAVFDHVKSIELCGFVTGKAFDEAILHADFLLHVEAFDEQSVDFVKHSVSTKIADSLACGVPFIAYGPREISSMKHIIKNDCAFVATDKSELKSLMKRVFEDRELKYMYVENALKTAKKYHSQEVNSQRLYSLLESVAQSGK